MGQGVKKRPCKFQSTHPCGVRQDNEPKDDKPLAVSIHAPVWGATPLPSKNACKAGFNPRTRVGCDDLSAATGVSQKVSIHAPVWGATNDAPQPMSIDIVSIHAPVWGATTKARPTRADIIVSIHAPVWGATSQRQAINRYSMVSIHAPVWGATAFPKLTAWQLVFQSTHPCGVRRWLTL